MRQVFCGKRTQISDFESGSKIWNLSTNFWQLVACALCVPLSLCLQRTYQLFTLKQLVHYGAEMVLSWLAKQKINCFLFDFLETLNFDFKWQVFGFKKAISCWMVHCRDIRVWSCDFRSTHACVHDIDMLKHCQMYHDINPGTAVKYQCQNQYETYDKIDRKDMFVTFASMTSMTK